MAKPPNHDDSARHADADVIDLDARRPPPPPSEPPSYARDATDMLIHRLVQRLPAPTASQDHLDASTLIAHLQRKLDPKARASVMHHLARCSVCVDRLEAAAEVMRMERVPAQAAAAQRATRPLLDVGRALMTLRIAVAETCMRVLSGDAEIRLGLATALRRGSHQGEGVAFQRRLDLGKLQLSLFGAPKERVQIDLTLDGAPTGCRGSLMIGGKLTAIEPLRHGRLIFRDVPVRTVLIRLEAPGHVLGHVRLELTPQVESLET